MHKIFHQILNLFLNFCSEYFGLGKVLAASLVFRELLSFVCVCVLTKAAMKTVKILIAIGNG